MKMEALFICCQALSRVVLLLNPGLRLSHIKWNKSNRFCSQNEIKRVDLNLIEYKHHGLIIPPIIAKICINIRVLYIKQAFACIYLKQNEGVSDKLNRIAKTSFEFFTFSKEILFTYVCLCRS